MKYPDQSAALLRLLKIDQKEWKEFAHAEYVEKASRTEIEKLRKTLLERVDNRAHEAMDILDQIGEPSIINIGGEAAQALSILATHHSLEATKRVLESFETLYKKAPQDTYKESIPAMTDWLAVLEHRPQRFGTIWLFDDKQYPFLPNVEDFEHVNERRESYGIEPLRWPRSLVIPETDQPWLLRPVSEANMRQPTSAELAALDYY
jgi:hypothetical protein